MIDDFKRMKSEVHSEPKLVDHEEETDCLKQPGCLCAHLQDDERFSGPICMNLRTNDTTRICLAVILGIFCGLLITLGRPEEPNKRSCFSSNSNSRIYPGSNVPCTDFGIMNKFFSSDELSNLQKRVPVCVDQENVTLSALGCTNLYYIGISTSTDVPFCYAEVNGVGYITKNDDGCSKFKKFTTVSPKIIYLESWHSTTSEPVSNPNKNESASLEWGAMSGSTVCGIVGPSCLGSIFTVEVMKEDPSSSIDKINQYASDIYDYDYYLKYVVHLPGKLWINSIQLIIVPVVICSIITAVSSMKDLPGSGKLGIGTFLYYFLTTVLAATEGLIITSMILLPTLDDLGLEAEEQVRDGAFVDMAESVTTIVASVIPKNGVKALSTNSDMLGVIFISIISGIAITDPKKSVFLKWFQELEIIMMTILWKIVYLTPLGVFFIVTYVFATEEIAGVFSNVGMFLLTIFFGLGFHVFVVYPLLLFFLTGRNPFKYFLNIIDAVVVALSISSSLATLPTTMKCALKKNKISEEVAKFVLTLGATMNMDGTSIGFPVAIVFIAYGQGIVLSFGELVTIVLLSTVSSMGAAPIPSSGVVLLIVMLESLQIPLGATFNLVLAVDWLYDRFETATNVIGDSYAAGVIDHWATKYEIKNTDRNKSTQMEIIKKIARPSSSEKKNGKEDQIAY